MSLRKKSGGMDMLHGPLLKNILLFALPLAVSSILQQLFNSADVAVIGWFEDSNAQAAVNSNGALINLLINLFAGLSVGVTVVLTEHIGRQQTEDLHSIVLTAFTVALVSGVILLGLGVGVAQPMLALMGTPDDVLPLAVEYLQIYFIGMPFVMLYNFGAAILRSVGDTRTPLYSLIVAGVMNVGLNFLFVAALRMSVAGVAVATVISDAVSAVIVVIFILRSPLLRIRLRESRIRWKYLKRIFVIGIPAGLQGVVFSLSNVFIQSAINSFGSNAMAGNGDALYFEYYVYYFVSAFAQTAVAFMGQNFAAGQYERCKKIFKLTMICSLSISTVLSVVFTLGGRWFIRIYTTDEEVIEFALQRMWCALLAEMLPSLYEISGGSLRGIGHSLLPAVITVLGSCVLRIVYIYTLFPLFSDSFVMLVIIYPITWIITGAAMLVAYFVISRREFSKEKIAL